MFQGFCGFLPHFARLLRVWDLFGGLKVHALIFLRVVSWALNFFPDLLYRVRLGP